MNEARAAAVVAACRPAETLEERHARLDAAFQMLEDARVDANADRNWRLATPDRPSGMDVVIGSALSDARASLRELAAALNASGTARALGVSGTTLRWLCIIGDDGYAVTLNVIHAEIDVSVFHMPRGSLGKSTELYRGRSLEDALAAWCAEVERLRVQTAV